MEKATKTHTLLILLRIILFVYIGKMLLWGHLGNNIIFGIYDGVVHEYLLGLLFGISSLCALAALIAMVVLTFKLTPATLWEFPILQIPRMPMIRDSLL